MGKLDDALKKIDELSDKYQKLTRKKAPIFDVSNITEANTAVNSLENSIDLAVIKAEELEEGWGGISSSIGASLSEMSKLDSASNKTIKAMRGIDNIAKDLLNHQQGISKLNTKQLASKKSKLAALTEEAKTQSKLAEDKFKEVALDKNGNQLTGTALKARLKKADITKNEFKSLQSIAAASAEDLTNLDKANDKLDEELKKRQKIEKSTGVLGGVLKGISKIPILGDLVDGDDAVKAMEESFEKSGSHIGALGAGMKNLGGQLLGSVLNPANLILGAITGLIAAIMEVDSATGDMAKSMGRSYSEALNTRKELTSIAEASGDAALNTKRLQETLTFVNKDLGTSGTLTEGNLKTFTKLREQAGMSNESIQSMNKYSMVMGGGLEKNTVNFQAQAKALSLSKGVSLNVKQLMGDMANVSNRTKLSIQGGADGLATAAVNAKLMGSNMADVEKIADSLLDFESSIEKELSAELLTGKNLNLEKARTAALNNDMATVAAEITKQAGTAAQFGDMNRIQQEAIAAAMGMSADGMADMLYEQEALKSIGVDLTDEQQKAFELAKDKYGIEEASRILKSEAQGEGIDGLVDQQSMQEDFNQSIESMKEIFVDIAQNVLPLIQMALEPIMAIMSGISTVVGYIIEGFKTLAPVLVPILGIMTAMWIKTKAVAIMSVIQKAWTGLGGLPVVGPALAIAAIAGGVGYINSQKVKDAQISPKGGLMVSGEKGTFQLDKEDSVIAGTDLGGNKKPKNNTQSQSSGTSVNVDMSQTNALLQQLISVISAGGDVTLDGQKVGNALNLVSYKTQ
jgi:hypothetical protein